MRLPKSCCPGESSTAKATREFSTQHRADSPIDVADRRGNLDPVLRRSSAGAACRINSLSESKIKTMVLGRRTNVGSLLGDLQEGRKLARKIEPRMLSNAPRPGLRRSAPPGRSLLSSVRKPSSARRFLNLLQRRDSKKFTTNSGLPLNRARATRDFGWRHPQDTCVEVANARHDAPGHDQRSCCESKLFGAEQRGDDDVATRFELPIDLHNDPARRLFSNRVCWVSASPSSTRSARHVSVKSAAKRRCQPSWPEMSTTSA